MSFTYYIIQSILCLIEVYGHGNFCCHSSESRNGCKINLNRGEIINVRVLNQEDCRRTYLAGNHINYEAYRRSENKKLSDREAYVTWSVC